MAGLKQIEVEVDGVKDLALVAADNAVWLVVPLRWWDLATIFWWLLMPSDKRASVKLTMTDGAKVNFRAVRVATRHVRIRGLSQ